MQRLDAVNLQATLFEQVFDFQEVAGAQSASMKGGRVFIPKEPLLKEFTEKPDPRSQDSAGPTIADLPEKFRVSIGIRPPHPKDDPDQFKLVIFCQDQDDLGGEIVGRSQEIADGDAIVEFIGPISAGNPNGLHPQPQADLRSGDSACHRNGTAGTLGAFVKIGNEGPYILSNNHVLADTNMAHVGDPILSPSPRDNGRVPNDVVARLHSMIPLSFDSTQPGFVDAALADVIDPHRVDSMNIRDRNTGASYIFSKTSNIVEEASPVWKCGRTSGRTSGIVSSILTPVTVEYNQNGFRRFGYFIDQISIQGDAGTPFSQPGDSGSLVLDDDNAAVGLLFAGPKTPDHPNRLSFANPMLAVLEALNCEFY